MALTDLTSSGNARPGLKRTPAHPTPRMALRLLALTASAGAKYAAQPGGFEGVRR